jgi:acyl-CoA thioester hydrolase
VTCRERMLVNWADTDASGRIHYTAAFRWAEVVEHAMYRKLGIERVDVFPRRHVEATFHSPLHFGEQFELVLSPDQIGTSSITYSWQATRHGSVCIEGHSVVVHVDDKGHPAPLPQCLRTLAPD